MTSYDFLTWDGILYFWQFLGFVFIAIVPPFMIVLASIGFLCWLLGNKK